MLLDYSETRRLLKGTPLEGLTNKQLKDAFIGEYPAMFSDKQLKRIWNKAMRGEKYEIEKLRSLEALSYLDHFKQQSIKAKKPETVDMVENIQETINRLLEYVAITQLLSNIQIHQDAELLKYELEQRRLKHVIKEFKV